MAETVLVSPVSGSVSLARTPVKLVVEMLATLAAMVLVSAMAVGASLMPVILTVKVVVAVVLAESIMV